jgi:hypothetical protein
MRPAHARIRGNVFGCSKPTWSDQKPRGPFKSWGQTLSFVLKTKNAWPRAGLGEFHSHGPHVLRLRPGQFDDRVDMGGRLFQYVRDDLRHILGVDRWRKFWAERQADRPLNVHTARGRSGRNVCPASIPDQPKGQTGVGIRSVSALTRRTTLHGRAVCGGASWLGL